jgi:hypothetical protein
MNEPRSNLLEYARRLYVRRTEAVSLIERRYRSADGWEPEPRNCHDNVARVVAENEGFTAVHGWYVSDLGDCFSFIAHSVVQTAEGELVNVTPTSESLPWRYPFLADGSPEYWTVADSALNRSIVCEAEGRPREEVAARAAVLAAENAALLHRLLGG